MQMADSLRLTELTLTIPRADSDLDAVHAIYSNPGTWTHLPSGRHTDISQTRTKFDEWNESWNTHSLGPWIVRDTETNQVLGMVGCSVQRNAFWNLGYRLSPNAQGRGVASRVAELAVRKANETNPDLPVIAYLLEHNTASAQVAQRIGLTLEDRCSDAGNPDPEAVRLIYSDRPLTQAQLEAARA